MTHLLKLSDLISSLKKLVVFYHLMNETKFTILALQAFPDSLL